MGSYLRPACLDDALQALTSGTRAIVAGGTDFYPARVGRPLDEDVLDVTALADLRGVTEIADGWRIGALTTWTDIVTHASLPPLFDGLKAAGRAVGGVQIQNTGTVSGNICNASPAADGVPALLALDAEVELASTDGRRRMKLASFITGNRRTILRSDEMVTAILVPRPPAGRTARSVFLKLGARRYLVISIVMIAATVELCADRRINAARIAVGSCSAVAQRLPLLEQALAGRELANSLGEVCVEAQLQLLSPMDDIRGTAAYRHDATLTLLRRALRELAQ